MLNKKTQTMLSELSAISTAVVLKYPVTGIQDSSKLMQAFINLEEFGEESFEDLGFFNLPEFLSVINVVDDAKITVTDGIVDISNDSMNIKYHTAKTDLLDETYSVNPIVLEKIAQAQEVGAFTLDVGTMDKLKKTSQLMKLNNLVVNGDGAEIQLEITDVKTKSSNNFKIGVDSGTASEVFNITLRMDLLRNLPVSDYTVSVVKNPKTGSFITLFTSLDIPSLKVVVLVLTEG